MQVYITTTGVTNALNVPVTAILGRSDHDLVFGASIWKATGIEPGTPLNPSTSLFTGVALITNLSGTQTNNAATFTPMNGR